MDYTLTSELQEYLEPTEKLIWTGQPKRGIVFRRTDIFLIPFSIVWCGMAIFGFSSVISSGEIFPFVFFGIPFILIGLFFVFGRFFVDARQRENTYYGLTENRIIIKSGVFRKSIKSLNIRTLSDVEYEEGRDGTGTINIGPRNTRMMWGNGMNWWPGYTAPPSIDLIPDVRKVYNKIIELQKVI